MQPQAADVGLEHPEAHPTGGRPPDVWRVEASTQLVGVAGAESIGGDRGGGDGEVGSGDPYAWRWLSTACSGGDTEQSSSNSQSLGKRTDLLMRPDAGTVLENAGVTLTRAGESRRDARATPASDGTLRTGTERHAQSRSSALRGQAATRCCRRLPQEHRQIPSPSPPHSGQEHPRRHCPSPPSQVRGGDRSHLPYARRELGRVQSHRPPSGRGTTGGRRSLTRDVADGCSVGGDGVPPASLAARQRGTAAADGHRVDITVEGSMMLRNCMCPNC